MNNIAIQQFIQLQPLDLPVLRDQQRMFADCGHFSLSFWPIHRLLLSFLSLLKFHTHVLNVQYVAVVWMGRLVGGWVDPRVPTSIAVLHSLRRSGNPQLTFFL